MGEQVHTVRVKFDSRKAETNAKRFDQQMGRMDKKAGGLGSTFAKLGGVLAAVGLAKITGEMFSTINATEKMKASLETMTGSTENANRAFGALQEFASTTPFTVDQSVQAFIKMKSLGLEPTADALTSFGNTASAMGKDMNQMIEAVADASTMEFERLKEFGIKARQEGDQVSFTFNNVTTTVGKNSEEIVEYLQNIGETRFAGAMEKQMERLPGKLSNMQDKVENLWRALGDAGATKAFGAIIDFISDGVGRITELFETGFAQENIKILLDAWVKPFEEAFDQVGQLWDDMTGSMDTEWGDTVGLWIDRGSEFLDWMALIPMAWQAVVTTILEIGGAMMANLGDGMKATEMEFSVVWEGIKNAGQVAWDTLRLGFAGMKDWVLGGLAGMLLELANMVQNLPFGDGMATQLRSAAAAMGESADAAAGIRAEMLENEQAHKDLVATITQERAAIIQHAKTRMAAAKGNASAAWLEVAAAKDAIDARQEEAEALLDAAGAGEDMTEVLEELAKGEEEAAKQTGLTAKEIADLDKASDSLEKQLQPLLDKIRGVSEQERVMMDATNLVDEAMRLGLIHTVDEATELLKLLEQQMGNTAEETDLMKTAMERGIERVTDSFMGMWEGFVSEGQAAFDGVMKGFESLIANLIHTATTQPIMLEIKNAMDDKDVNWDNLGDAAGTLIGTAGGSMLGGGGAGASMGSALGSLIGGMTPLGPLGAALGGIAGGLIGGLFDSDKTPIAEMAATPYKDAKKGQVMTGESDFGSLWLHTRRLGEAATQDLMEQVRGFDNAIAEWLAPEKIAEITDRLASWSLRIESESVSAEQFIESRFEVILKSLDQGIQGFVGQGGTMEEMTERLFLAFNAEKLMKDNADIFGEATLEQFLALAELAKEPMEGLGQAMDRIVAAMAQAALATEVLGEYIGSDLVENFQTLQEEQNRTTQEWLKVSGDQIREMVAEFDGSSSGLADIAGAVQERYQLELQYLAQIRGLIDSISERLQGTRDRIEETLNPKTAEDYYLELQTLKDQLELASSPEEVDRITRAMDAAANALFNAVNPANQEEAGAYLLNYLESAEADATALLETMEAAAVADSNQLRADLGTWMDTVGDPLALAAVELGVAAEDLQLVADSFGTAEPGTPPAYGIDPGTGQPVYGGGKYPSSDINDLSNNVSENNLAMKQGADTLAREGRAYRDATADQAAAARALAAAVRSLPERIYLVQESAPSEYA